MSIVADERVIPVQPVAGLAEEIERQEREDNERGPEPEPEPTGWATERQWSRSYVGEGRVDLRYAQDTPLAPGAAERVAELAAEHQDHLVRYIAVRLGGVAYWTAAEDIAQDVWMSVVRGRLPKLLEEDCEYVWPRLAAAAKYQILEATRLRDRPDWVVRVRDGDDRSPLDVLDALAGPGPDSTVCAVTDLLDEEGSPPVWPPACYAEQIAALTPRQREVLELRCVEGMTTDTIAARLGIARQNVERALKLAVVALGGSGKVAGARSRGAGTPLPAGWEQVVNRLASGEQREVVRLRATGASFGEIAAALGRHRDYAHRVYTRAVALLREMDIDRRADPVEPAPVKSAPSSRPATPSCSETHRCASGCYLRPARAV
ncbi:RNA polymerase sigma factor [Streptomyces sp. ADI98-12]|uniref:RNA polymerase sigma factor n=1 Tax=Streptomyces sp. ADI98-12 TaxID=1522764 RepID=UPI000F54C662|nr:sigma-70 family RNA polymerase sigma factor [Streptomyces sp. ADI98-12]RPK78692.1 RNA polymerase sigma factor [Streptomyces sp. ADI98-12]